MAGRIMLTHEQKMQRVKEAQDGARRRGWIVAEEDDPIYSEGPSIMFCAHMPKQSPQPSIISLPGDSQNDSNSLINRKKKSLK